ncbi:hypothetical protein M378DRAFT_168512 [Amanita muscaria Koide BX008]|uniref:Uncharacterized protein n=1 Tax=Amanita muscaria (strain Koide BX008) TaxID=946122 RepID=A0A0C2SBA7_AMAMK|nr:hypothetical protein M378DRAFT_168512 [Amanita muscaria Koide BX008]
MYIGRLNISNKANWVAVGIVFTLLAQVKYELLWVHGFILFPELLRLGPATYRRCV